MVFGRIVHENMEGGFYKNLFLTYFVKQDGIKCVAFKVN